MTDSLPISKVLHVTVTLTLDDGSEISSGRATDEQIFPLNQPQESMAIYRIQSMAGRCVYSAIDREICRLNRVNGRAV